MEFQALETTPNLNEAESGTSTNPTRIYTSLVNYLNVLKFLEGIPSQRDIDHQIHLVEGTSPVNTRPYRYLHLQKVEIERDQAFSG